MSGYTHKLQAYVEMFQWEFGDQLTDSDNEKLRKVLKALEEMDQRIGRVETKGAGTLAPTIWAVCSECGDPIDPWDKYCRHCGAILASEVIGGEE